ncbi:MAG TPA: GNAT family N-acetyltransferase [Steroidobacteraceae bacterium]
MQTRLINRVAELPAAEWNALAGQYPFLRHEFLAAIEDSGCASARSGWRPQHLLLIDQHGLAAAAPLYQKEHSWGEFVFDFAWARAAEQAGMAYYPKLVCAVPFTPATGPRLLCRADLPPAPLRRALLRAMREYLGAAKLSSVHALFLDEPARAACEQDGWLLRRDCHFQWHNRGYRDFADFLDGFSADKRKKVRRERRRVLEQGIEFQTLQGDQLSEAMIERVFRLHEITFIRHGHTPYLNRAFFSRIARTLPSAFFVKLAMREGEAVAAAVFFRSADTLYGRYWGADADYHSLHFEACYYQGIDYCIAHGLSRFEPGTQGEHKIARGFEPALTWSAHWIADVPLRRAIGAYLAREGQAIDAYASEADAHAPFRKSEPAA